jgi:tetratricopeptide (TPR) repeat protein
MSEEQDRRVPIPEAMRQAVELHEAGDLNTAAAYYQAILDSEPGHPGAAYNLALIKLQTQREIEALPVLRAALERDPAQGSHWLNFAVALVGAGYPEQAREALLRARQHGLGGKTATEMLAKIETAIATGAGPRAGLLDKDTVRELAELFDQQRHAEAQARAEQLTARYPRAGAAWYFLGLAKLEQGFFEQAVAPLERARALAPTSPLALNLLGVAYRHLERYADARTVFEQGLALVADAAPESFDLLLNAAANALALNDAAAANDYAQRALQVHPDSPPAIRLRADAHAAAGEAEAAALLYARLPGDESAPPAA